MLRSSQYERIHGVLRLVLPRALELVLLALMLLSSLLSLKYRLVLN